MKLMKLTKLPFYIQQKQTHSLFCWWAHVTRRSVKWELDEQ